jgi:hypothetical protein
VIGDTLAIAGAKYENVTPPLDVSPDVAVTTIATDAPTPAGAVHVI